MQYGRNKQARQNAVGKKFIMEEMHHIRNEAVCKNAGVARYGRMQQERGNNGGNAAHQK